jgi:uncharacterized protein YuzE
MNYNKNYIQYISGIINEETYRLRENYDQDTKVYAFKNNDEITFKNPHDNNKIKGKIIEIKVDHEPHTNQEMPQNDETVLKVDSEGKIVSITIEPPSRKPNCTAAKATTGTIALRKACLNTTVRVGKPFARAVRI